MLFIEHGGGVMDSELNDWREEVCGCGDVQLMAELQRLVRIDRRCEGRLLVCLAEVDGRRLFLEQGYSSLFRYAVGVLRMSEAQAYLRIQAARLLRLILLCSSCSQKVP
jgi:hypothetical protein